MVTVKFYAQAADDTLKYAVIAARYQGKWLFCRHKDRRTYEIPGGHREAGETILDAANRELYEETGALEYTLSEVCVYSVVNPADASETFGMLYLADVDRMGPLPAFEIGEVSIFDSLPDLLTYPEIQPALWQRAEQAVHCLKGDT